MNQVVNIEFPNEIVLFVKREDLLHPQISGNKFRKLKYNLQEAKNQGFSKLLTFGGAFSNHIAATAAAGNEFGFHTIGVIRGEELVDKIDQNATLSLAKENGMQFEFVSRECYRQKETTEFIEKISEKYGKVFVLPEGGTNELAVKGCEEILTASDADFTHVCCAVGTGGTVSGIINSLHPNQKAIGFAVLKGDFLSQDICRFAKNGRWFLNNDYHFGGYAKINEELVRFLNDFHKQTGIPLDPVYTGKMFFGILDLIKKDYFKKGSKILAIHTGGLQGIRGMNEVLKKKGLPIIDYI
ncbi:pyridoxal-phosphate dependent enzyme [Flavobacterium sp. SM15]|uniref:1-aminocyclopropane-1-carboxylate deaminase/D-cysteine desulfhydrase n=1 Tax=Flavobacterium sp. SM15 TaxID=2908005 RepID=UPI001EDB251D|nr:pyridoxal-phosphate dependent enzyme [Flavobacterium sp. SM15]MCG2610616.1 pyridoxal-phosphate dependent enzyme [Flavobacterium sp. SM15]